MANKDGLCISYLILACSIFVCSGFAYWLYTDSDIEKLRDFKFRYNWLLTYERQEDAEKFRTETLASIFDDEIDIMWLPVISKEPDGYAKLQFYSRLLAGNPDQDVIYRDIADTMNAATEEYSIKERTRYLTRLKATKGVHHILLERYDLLITAEN